MGKDCPYFELKMENNKFYFVLLFWGLFACNHGEKTKKDSLVSGNELVVLFQERDTQMVKYEEKIRQTYVGRNREELEINTEFVQFEFKKLLVRDSIFYHAEMYKMVLPCRECSTFKRVTLAYFRVDPARDKIFILDINKKQFYVLTSVEGLNYFSRCLYH